MYYFNDGAIFAVRLAKNNTNRKFTISDNSDFVRIYTEGLMSTIQTLSRGVSASLISFLTFSSPSQATLISSGAVFPSTPSYQANYNGTMVVGFATPADGLFEVNAGPGYTSVSNTGMMIGATGATGTVRVIGNGSTGSARIDIGPGFGLRTGNGGTGNLEIRNGGVVNSNEEVIYLGTQGLSSTPGVSNVIIDGNGSILQSQQASSGDWWARDGGRIYVGFGGQSDSTVTVSNGGLMQALSGNVGDQGDDGSIWVGSLQDPGSSATVNVLGTGSTMRADTYIEVGSDDIESSSYLNVMDGGRVETASSYIGTLYGVADVLVSGAGSTLDSEKIQIGGTSVLAGYTASGLPGSSPDWNSLTEGEQVQDINGNLLFDAQGDPVLAVLHPSWGALVPDTYLDDNMIYVKNTGSLTVEAGASVNAQTINVSENRAGATTFNNQGATLTVRDGAVVTANVNVFEDGVLNGGQGQITGNVVVDGGTVAPGNSPGVMYIAGNLELLDGVLELEVTDTLMDSFVVSGDLVIGEDLIVDIMLDIQTSSFLSLNLEDFFQVAGNTTIDPNFNLFDNVNVSGLSNHSELLLSFNGNQRTFGAVAAVPEPSTLALLGLSLMGLVVARRKRKFASQ